MIPERLDQINDQQAKQICDELREQIIDSVSKTGGHLASSLGVVELTVALHRVYDLNRDRLVFDVGHQCYAHKILTGRGPLMDTLRQFGGLSGFPKPSEHRADAFIAGHASNSVSVALGMAKARTIKNEDYHVIAMLGDGALTGGLAYEGLSNVGQSGEHILVVLNDNGMSITKNVGGIAKRLSSQRLKPQYLSWKKTYRKLNSCGPLGRGIYRVTHQIKEMVKDALLSGDFFEDMGYTYLGPVDGHDVRQLTRLLHYAKDELSGPVLLHIKTVKGKGYPPAEREPDRFHGIGTFCKADGKAISSGGTNFSAVFGQTMSELAQEQENLCVITAAMELGTGLKAFAEKFPNRFFDVGIAEEHAVSMAAGMAKQGLLPVFAVYSSFLQRSYDMLIHDVAIQNLHVVFAVDRAGLVGDDGETHHGVFDVAYLSSVPGMRILCPANYKELMESLRHAVLEMGGPVAVRYPRGSEGTFCDFCGVDGSKMVRDGSDVTIISYGSMMNEALAAADILAEDGIHAEVLKLNSIVPMDTDAIVRCASHTGKLLVAEECVDMACIGRRIASELMMRGMNDVKIGLANLGSHFVTHGTVSQLRTLCGIDAAALAEKAKEVMANG